MRFLATLLFLSNLYAGFVILQSTVSSGSSESSSSNLFLRQGVGQSVVGQDNSSSFIEQSGYYTWILYIQAGVGIKELGKGEKLTFNLASPRPNPAFRSVGILYSVPLKSRVRIAVYDVAGRLVKLLVDEVKNPGRYELIWQGRDNRNREANEFRPRRLLPVRTYL